jgi:hypothetical protein
MARSCLFVNAGIRDEQTILRREAGRQICHYDF